MATKKPRPVPVAPASLYDLVRKRFAGDGWVVVPELRSHIDVGKARGRADAVAFGLWSSNKYEAHGFEFKETRADLKTELVDPSKCEYVGRYCAFWWLVVRDQELIVDLEIPAMWGILVPVTRGGHPELRTIRKATRRTPEPLEPGFIACLIRTALATFKSPTDVRDLQQRVFDLETAVVDDAAAKELEDLQHQHTQLKRHSERFEESVAALCTHLGITREDLDTWGPQPLAEHIKFARRWCLLPNLPEALELLLTTSASFARMAGTTSAFASALRDNLGIHSTDGDHHAQCPARNRKLWQPKPCICGLESAVSQEQRQGE